MPSLDITPRALEVLERATAAASRFNPDARVRVFRGRDGVEAGFTDAAAPGDSTIEIEGITVYVEEGLQGTLDASDEHDRLYLR